MICNVVRYSTAKGDKWGVVEGEKVHEIKGDFATTRDFIESGKQLAYEILKDNKKAVASHDYQSIEVLSPITRPCKVLCQGANYRQHMIESGMNPEDKKFNMIFNKSCASISKPDTDIVRPSHVKLLDYEIELTLVLGKNVEEAVNVTRGNIHEYVAGICIGNDVSARDIQIPEMQFFKGKSYRTFCPLGPHLCLLEKEDMKYLDELKLVLTVNGEVRQDGCSSDLVFKPADTLTELSQISNFAVGDVVMTGTPNGCALSPPKPLLQKIAGLLPENKKWEMFKKMQGKRREFLQHGDVVETVITSRDGRIDLGKQTNRVVAL